MRHFYSYGPVDCEEHFCIFRKKPFEDCTAQSEVKDAIKQAAQYARALKQDSVVIALFITTNDEKVLSKFSIQENIDGVMVIVMPVGWV